MRKKAPQDKNIIERVEQIMRGNESTSNMAVGTHAIAMAESAHRVQARLQATEQLGNIARDEFCRVLNGRESLESSSGFRGVRRRRVLGRRLHFLGVSWLHRRRLSTARVAGLRAGRLCSRF